MFVNKAIIVGNITRDPELKALPSGQSVCTFSVATNKVFYDKDKQKQERTEFHNVVAWGKTGEHIAQYMKKGSQIFVEGELQTRSWDDKETGKKLYRTEINAFNVQFGSNRTSDRTEKGKTESSDSRIDGLTPQDFDDYGSAPKAAESSSGSAVRYPDEDINPADIPF